MAGQPDSPPRISVLMTGRNCEKWIAQAIRSVLGQDYPNFELLVGLDAPEDGSAEIAEMIFRSNPRFYLRVHPEKITTLENHWQLVLLAGEVNPSQIVAIVDADDYLLHGSVLSRVAREYQEDPEVDMTHGSFLMSTPEGLATQRPCEFTRGPGCFSRWCFHHLKTWRRDLSLQAFTENPEAFRYEDGSPIEYGPDVAFTYPVAARARKVVTIQEPLYMYRLHQNNEHVDHRAEQLRTERYCGNYWQALVDREAWETAFS